MLRWTLHNFTVREKENISNYFHDSFIDYQQEMFLSIGRKVSWWSVHTSVVSCSLGNTALG